MSASHAWVAGIGMMTSVGDSAVQTATSIRAGISAYAESDLYNKRFEPMILALLPDEALPPLQGSLASQTTLTTRYQRMLRLAHKAMHEALLELPEAVQVPMFLASPELYSERTPVVDQSFIANLVVQSGTEQLDQGLSRIFPTGRAAAFQAVQAALQYLSSGVSDFVLVGGVDSYLDLHLLGSLDSEDRVLASGVMDGFCPGEGAGFILLCNDQGCQRLARSPQVKIVTPGLAQEPGHRGSEQPYRGDGLAQAVRLALKAVAGSKVCTVLAGINGENFGAKEWGVTVMRNQDAMTSDFRFEHPADCFGDLGAAIGSVLMGLGATGLAQGYMNGPVLAWAASEGATRGAVCLVKA